MDWTRRGGGRSCWVRRWDLGEKNEKAQREGRELAAGAVERMTEAEG